jgi:hypothetical protein
VTDQKTRVAVVMLSDFDAQGSDRGSSVDLAAAIMSQTAVISNLEARISRWTRKLPTDGSTHWSTRTLAKTLKLKQS